MFGFQSLKLSLLLTWMLLFPAQTQHYSEKTGTVGEDVTLICEVFREFPNKCYSFTWMIVESLKTAAETLYEEGKFQREAGSKSDRLSLAEKCSLVIKKVTVEDAGDYTCRQFNTSGHQVTDSSVHLSVTKPKTQRYSKTVMVGEDVTLTCEDLREYQEKCYITSWIFSNSTKTASVVRLYERGKVSREAGSKSDRLSLTEKCSLVIKKVTVEDAGRYICRQYDTSRLHVSESTVHLSVTDETTPKTIKPRPTTTTTTTASIKTSTIPPTTTTMTTTTAALIVAAVGFSALFITTVIIIRWKKTKRNKTQTCDTPELDWNPAGTRSGPETSQEAADPPDVVHYASISYTNNTRARVHGGDHDDYTVTYSTVGAPAAASTDPSGLYATVQKTT